MTSPVPGSTLTTTTITFDWDAGTQEDLYRLHVGTTGPGSKDIVTANALTTTSQIVTGLPTEGNIYVRLWWRVAGNWKNVDYVYPSMTVPAPAAVPRTGQTSFLPLNPAPPGSDGDLQTGVAWPIPRFTDNGDGTITDNLTNLIWDKDANRFGERKWTDALSDCQNLADGAAGLRDGSAPGDWYLPNRFELESLFHLGVFNPAVPDTRGTGQWSNGDPFNNIPMEGCWTSTSVAWNTGGWTVGFNGGTTSINNKVGNFAVWCVRGGQ